MPLPEEGLGHYSKAPADAFREELGYDQTCFDRLPEPDLIRQDAAAFRNTAKREHDRVYLMWVWVNPSATLSGRVAAVLIGSA